jgi:hypothetical protein
MVVSYPEKLASDSLVCFDNRSGEPVGAGMEPLPAVQEKGCDTLVLSQLVIE